MKYVFWLIKFILFITLFAFALSNQQTATVNFFLGNSVVTPQVLVILSSFGLGIVMGILVMVPRWWKWRRAASSANSQVKSLQSQIPSPTAEVTSSSVVTTSTQP